VKGQGKLNMHINFESVPNQHTKNYQISLCFSILHLAKDGAFF